MAYFLVNQCLRYYYVSMLINLILANIRFLSCSFFLFPVIPSNFFIITVVKEKVKVRLAPVISIRAPKTLAEEIMQTPPLVALKTIKTLS